MLKIIFKVQIVRPVFVFNKENHEPIHKNYLITISKSLTNITKDYIKRGSKYARGLRRQKKLLQKYYGKKIWFLYKLTRHLLIDTNSSLEDGTKRTTTLQSIRYNTMYFEIFPSTMWGWISKLNYLLNPINIYMHVVFSRLFVYPW